MRTATANLESLSAAERVLRMLCHMLRHCPKPYRVRLDAFGWASTDHVICAINRRSRKLCLWHPWQYKHLAAFMDEHADRFERQNNRLRARYGHSLPVTAGIECLPPELLFHGTPDYYMNAIRMLGIKAYTRHFVHLTTDTEYAQRVAEAKDGSPIVLTIRAAEAATNGLVFRRANEHVWLVKHLPFSFVSTSKKRAEL